jgi:phospholipid/cholesterol/gamma-HCH transport system substrate-binding protein
VNQQKRELAMKFRVGVFVLVALGAFLGMIYLLGARARLFEARYTIHADFTEVGGLTEGATVRLAGVQIGRVSQVTLPSSPGGRVRVDLTIARRFADRVRKDSVARIETQGLLGDKIIELTVGTAQAPPVGPGDVIASRDPSDIGQIVSQGAATVKDVAALAESLREITVSVQQSRIVEDAAATMATARKATDQLSREAMAAIGEVRSVTGQVGRIVDQVEHGRGWAHVLLYEEPVALRRLNEALEATRVILDRVERGEGALGVLTSAESSAAARRLVAAMDRFGRIGDGTAGEEGLLPSLLFDPQYRAVLDDLREVARNFREVSDRLAGGRGMLGSLVKDEPGDGGLRQASRDLQEAVANLREITGKLNEGEGTLGALIADPTIYERLVSILDGAQRSFLLRGLLRGLGASGDRQREPAAGDGKGRAAPGEERRP